MNNQLRTNSRLAFSLPVFSPRVLLGPVFWGLLALAVASVSQQANAQSSAKYRIGENMNVVRAALDLDRGDINQDQFDDILMKETCQNPSSRLQDRNRPYLMVWNTSTVADAITSVVINLQEAGFEFGDGDVVGDGFDGLLSMLSKNSDPGVALTSASYGADSTELQLNFSGLSQGMAAIFRVDLDEPNGVFMFPDYREAFQGANGGLGRDGDLAILKTNFSQGPTRNSTFPRLGELLGLGRPESYHSQSMTPPPASIVPEPASLLLLVAGLTGIAAGRRKPFRA